MSGAYFNLYVSGGIFQMHKVQGCRAYLQFFGVLVAAPGFEFGMLHVD
jgi:hypothetical protein